MKKLFLVLASVLLLGGCSVDDYTSVIGGGVSNGGDDMAITTYPNVVEASRTAVEGGYLVDYVYIHDAESSFSVGLLSFISRIWDIFDRYVDVNSDNYLSEIYRLFSERLFNFECYSSYGYFVYSLRLQRIQYLESNKTLFFYVGGEYYYDSGNATYCIELRMKEKGVSVGNSIYGNTSYPIGNNGVTEFLRGRFTIFEPSE